MGSIITGLESIQKRMAGYERKVLPPLGLTPAAITLPLVFSEKESLDVIFTLRSLSVEHHKGEISFPGGKIEPYDKSEVAAALRETFEETGIEPANATVLGLLDDHISISGFLVTPVVVFISGERCGFCPEPGEVREIFSVPLAHLADRSNYINQNHRTRSADFHEFHYGDKRIWGLTASVLHRFLQIAIDF